jgi:hypothetical protein
MGFWFVLILWAVTFAVSQLLTPDPKTEDARAATLDDFNFPTATEGRFQPWGWGTWEIKGPNVLWYGDLKTRAIISKIKVSMFKKKKVVTGHRYYVGFQMGICQGPVALRKITVGDEVVWSGNKTTDGDIAISARELKGTFTFYTGSGTQAVDSYLDTYQTICPAYRHLSYGVWKGGYVGQGTSIKPWKFEVTRIPTGLGSTHPIVNTYDCNLMEMAYELLTDDANGYGHPAADVDVSGFQTAAETLYTEGNGISLQLQRARPIPELLKEIERQADAHFRIDATTGKWKVELARDGYSIPSLRNSADHIKEVVNFSRASWDETVNSVRIAYERRANGYDRSFMPAHDGANMKIQGRIVPATWTFEGVKDDTLANAIAWRELRAHSYPLSKGRFIMDRTFWNAYVGEVFRLNYTFGNTVLTDLPMRITKIDLGNREAPEITVDAVQDVFSWRVGAFADPDATSWTAPVKTLIPFPSGQQVGFESPYAMTRRDEVTTEGRVFISGAQQGREEVGYLVRQRNASGTPTGDYYDAGTVDDFMFVGTLDGAIDNDATTIDVTTDMPLSEIVESTAVDVGNELTNLFMIGNEFVACTGASEISGGLRLTGCYRGLLDSAQASHADAATVRFIFVGGGLSVTAFNNTYNVDIKLLPFDFNDNQVSESDAGITVLQIDMDKRERRPYPPTFMDLNSVQYPSGTVSLDVSHGGTDDDDGIKVEFNRRDYRIYDEVSQNHTDAETLDPTFPAANTTQYAVEVYKVVSGTPTLLYTTGWQATATDYAYRSTILRYMDGVIPSEMQIRVKTRHTYATVVLEAVYTLDWEFDTASTELSGDFNFGALADLAVSNSWTAPDTGSYSCTIGHANTGGPIEYRLNGGGWSTAIATSSTTGSIPGVTAADTIEVRSNGLTLAVNETIMKVNSPASAEDAYAIFKV